MSFPATQKCAKCDAQATKRVIWAEGMAYQPACDKHVDAVKHGLEVGQKYGPVDAVRDIPKAGTSMTTKNVKAEWEKAHAERDGWLPHEFADDNGKCGICFQRQFAGEHVAYTEQQRAYVEANTPKHPFVAKAPHVAEPLRTHVGQFSLGASRTHGCTVCGMPSSHPLHDDQPTSVSPAPANLVSVDPVLNEPGDLKQLAEYEGSGCMVALYPSAAALGGIKTAGRLPLEAKEDMHVTLAYMVKTPTGDDLENLKSVVQDMARTQGVLTGVWGGTARFNPSEGSDGKPVLVALPDLPDLPTFRENLVTALNTAGFPVSMTHGYTPHLTVAYDDSGQVRAEGELSFDSITLAAADGKFTYPLTGEIDMDAEAAGVTLNEHAATSVDDDRFAQMGKLAQGVDAAVDDALTHLRSCADLPPYALQAQAVLQGIDPACDELLEFFGVGDADDDDKADSEKSFDSPSDGAEGIPGAGVESAAMVKADKAAESAQIDMNKKTNHAQASHPFLPSMYQAPPVCLMCGAKEPEQGLMCSGLAPGQNDITEPDPAIMARFTDMRDRAFVEAEKEEMPKERAFLTEVAGRTILTGPASVMGIEKAMTTNEHFLWMQGKFVGAEKANRNGAFWTTADLEMGEPTVRYGPLNWLHEAKHIIGTLADQRLVRPSTEQAAEGMEPHIFTLSPIWKWIYPDEAYVVEQASDAGKLWYCVDTDTELMTADGWKRQDELKGDETILTLNTSLGMSEWLPLDNVFRYEVDTDLVAWEGQQMSALTTPNHRWPVQQRDARTGQRRLEWRETATMTNSSYVHRAVPHHFPDDIGKFRDEFVSLVAWMQTDGTLCKGGGSVIYQSHAANPQKVERIRTDLMRLFGAPAYAKDGGKWYVSHHGRMTHFHLTAEATAPFRAVLDSPSRQQSATVGNGKVVAPRWYSQLSEAQLRLFIETSVDGDGTRARADGQVSFSQNSLAAVRSFEVACALAGIPTNTSSEADANGMWRVCLVRRSNTVAPRRLARMGNGFTETREHYVGTVWCPSTSNGTFLARRRGTVYWTGNSMECVSKEVECVGDGGCGAVAPYRDYLQAAKASYTGMPSKACTHMRQKSATRRFSQPTFLGAAIILPPVRPGWAEADARVIRQAAAMTEDAYEQAGQPASVTASEWEQMMVSVMRYAQLE